MIFSLQTPFFKTWTFSFLAVLTLKSWFLESMYCCTCKKWWPHVTHKKCDGRQKGFSVATKPCKVYGRTGTSHAKGHAPSARNEFGTCPWGSWCTKPPWNPGRPRCGSEKGRKKRVSSFFGTAKTMQKPCNFCWISSKSSQFVVSCLFFFEKKRTCPWIGIFFHCWPSKFEQLLC